MHTEPGEAGTPGCTARPITTSGWSPGCPARALAGSDHRRARPASWWSCAASWRNGSRCLGGVMTQVRRVPEGGARPLRRAPGARTGQRVARVRAQRPRVLAALEATRGYDRRPGSPPGAWPHSRAGAAAGPPEPGPVRARPADWSGRGNWLGRGNSSPRGNWSAPGGAGPPRVPATRVRPAGWGPDAESGPCSGWPPASGLPPGSPADAVAPRERADLAADPRLVVLRRVGAAPYRSR